MESWAKPGNEAGQVSQGQILGLPEVKPHYC